jgi:hypothetical protein
VFNKLKPNPYNKILITVKLKILQIPQFFFFFFYLGDDGMDYCRAEPYFFFIKGNIGALLSRT